MGREERITRLEDKSERNHKDRREHYAYSMNGIKANAKLRAEQDVDLVLKNMKLKILGQP